MWNPATQTPATLVDAINMAYDEYDVVISGFVKDLFGKTICCENSNYYATFKIHKPWAYRDLGGNGCIKSNNLSCGATII